MPAFLIVKQIQSGEYEKITTTLVCADSEQQACEGALLGECHSGLGEGADWLEEGQQIEDLYGEFIYTLYSVKLVPDKDLEVLSKYMDTHHV
tara:strand:+ start:350 stop:625 length:276 start_codon:yes stop_codon:yes gene_type:complete